MTDLTDLEAVKASRTRLLNALMDFTQVTTLDEALRLREVIKLMPDSEEKRAALGALVVIITELE